MLVFRRFNSDVPVQEDRSSPRFFIRGKSEANQEFGSFRFEGYSTNGVRSLTMKMGLDFFLKRGSFLHFPPLDSGNFENKGGVSKNVHQELRWNSFSFLWGRTKNKNLLLVCLQRNNKNLNARWVLENLWLLDPRRGLWHRWPPRWKFKRRKGYVISIFQGLKVLWFRSSDSDVPINALRKNELEFEKSLQFLRKVISGQNGINFIYIATIYNETYTTLPRFMTGWSELLQWYFSLPCALVSSEVQKNGVHCTADHSWNCKPHRTLFFKTSPHCTACEMN